MKKNIIVFGLSILVIYDTVIIDQIQANNLPIESTEILLKSNELQLKSNKIDFIPPEEALQILRQRPQLKTPLNRRQSQQSKSIQINPVRSQVTKVSELRDVSSKDWSYQTLNSLMKRYNCLADYWSENGQGDKFISRQVFASKLNLCLKELETLSKTNFTILREDIDKLKRLTQEFNQELISSDSRLHNLEQRTAFIERNYFSTTTKLQGYTFVYVSNSWRDNNLLAEGESVINPFQPPRDQLNRPRVRVISQNPNTTLSYFTLLNLNTSFSGKDKLALQLAAGNGIAPVNEFLSAGFFNSSGAPFALQDGTPTLNSITVREIYYEFPVRDNLKLSVGPRIQIYNYFDTNRFTFFITGSETFNSGGSTQFSAVDRGSGMVAIWDINETFRLNMGYVGNNSDYLPGEIVGSASDPNVLRGLFGGTYNLIAELDIAPTDNLNLRFLYSRNRLESNPFNGFVGGAIGEPIPYGFADDGFGGPLRHAFGDVFLFNFDWLVTQGFGLFGRYSYGSTDLTPENPERAKGAIDSQSFQLGFALPDLFKEGAQGNFSFLIPFSILNGREFLLSGGGDGAVQSEMELNYYYPLNNNIALVPSFYLISKPNNFSQNPPIYVFNLRTQFSF
ncbi:MAG: iron uptake porin [Crocosphaera sp.]|nr:iron uptake porin [Crocosphaera sp.]